jgi:hypothetical protein
MSLLKLIYSRASDPFETVTLLGDPKGIRDLYWQLTHNYMPQDGTAIGSIKVNNLEGIDVMKDFMVNPYACASQLSNMQD